MLEKLRKVMDKIRNMIYEQNKNINKEKENLKEN